MQPRRKNERSGNHKRRRYMKSIRRFATMAFLCLFLALSLGIVLFATSACSQNGKDDTSGDTLSGSYYTDVEGDEYTFVFDGESFTFTLGENALTGTYVYDGSAVSLTFSDGTSASAAFDGDILEVTYNGVTYEMLPRIEYIVTFDLDGGEGTESATVLNGRTLTRPTDPTKSGFVFLAWYQDSSFKTVYSFDTPVTSNMTLYARFVEDLSDEEFVVSFDTGSDYTGDPVADMETIGGCVYMLPELPAQGTNAFLGWWMSDSQDAAKLTAKVEDGQKLDENTTLFAVWDNGAPAVSVTSTGVSWLSMGVNISYTITILGPDGSPTTVNGQISSALTQAFDFASAQAGEYVVTVAARGKTTTAYYTNKQLARASLFKVEGSTLIFNEVANAEYYLLSYTCGTVGHTHTDIRLDTASYDFSDCEMAADGFSFVVKAVADGYVTSVSAPFVFERHLEQVTGIAVDTAKDVLTWDAVENATSYTITIETESGTKSFTSQALSFDLQSFYGTLHISVSAAAHGYNASAAAKYVYNKTRLSTPANIRTSGDSIVWDAVSGATGYVVAIGDKQYTVTENKFTPEDLSAVGSEFTVTVQAVAADTANNSFTASAVVSRELTNIVYADGTLSWNPVIGVSKYGVRVNGGEEMMVEDASRVAVALTQAGQNVLQVRYYTGSKPSDWIGINVDASVTVTLDNNTGTGSTTSKLYFAANDHILLPSDAERLGYTFSGWFTSATGGQKVESGSVTATANVTYYAHWTANTYVVTITVPESEGYFESGSGQVYTMEVDVTFGSVFTLPVPYSKDGTRAFFGWYNEFGGTGTQYTDPDGASLEGRVWNLASDQTFYPSWVEAFSYTLIAHPDNPTQQSYAISQGPGINYLTKVTVPAMYNGLPVTTIESNCFARCAKLQVINIPDSIVQIFTGDNGSNGTGSAFYNCTGLKEIVIYDASASISGNYKQYFSTVDGVLIYDNPFGETELAFIPLGITGEFTIPDVVTTIPLRTFDSTNITVINVPASVTQIGMRAFGSSKITEVNFLPAAEGTQEKPLVIEDEAFYYSNIQEITLPARLSNFNVNIFTSCDELQRVNVEASATGTSVYTSVDGIVFSDNGATIVFCPEGRTGEYVVLSSVTKIGERAFYGCDKLTKIVIPGNVVEIGTEAFRGCTMLNQLVFQGISSDPALTIGESAFYGCTSLTSLSLPENLKVLGQYAFGNIVSLTKVTINTALPEIDYSNGAFASMSGKTYVRTLVLGPNVVVFDVNGVFGSTSLTSVEVDPSNQNYEAVDGVLFNKGMTRIVYYPSGRTGAYTLPDSVQEIGANVFNNNGNLTSITLSANLTSIGESAFQECEMLTEVIFESGSSAGGTLAIGKKAFFHSTSLVSVTLPEGKTEITIGDEAFAGCAGLKTMVFPEGVTSIGHAALHFCRALTSVSLPASLKSLTSYSTSYDYTDIISGNMFAPSEIASAGTDNIDVFNYCQNLKTITIAEGNTNYVVIDGVLYGKNTETGVVDTLYFSPMSNPGTDGKVTIPATVTDIKDRAFFNNTAITVVEFEDRTGAAALTIGSSLFYSATNLAEVTLPSGLTEIPERMFSEASLKTIYIPNTVTSIGEGAFYKCASLAEIVFEEGGTSPLVLADGTNSSSGSGSSSSTSYYGVFAGCASLKAVVLPERTTEIGDYAFYRDTNRGGESGLERLTIPSTVTRIGEYAFAIATLKDVTFTAGGSAEMTIERYAFNQAAIEELNLPSTVVSIGENAFQSNAKLTAVSFPASLKTIENYAFYNNPALASVTFAENSLLESIGEYAFTNCSALAAINLENCTSLTVIDAYAFKMSGLVEVKIPASVETIGASAFQNCGSLTAVEFITAAAGEDGVSRSNLKSIENLAFAGTSISEMIFPESNSNITLGNYLFSTCNKLTTIHLSTSIVDIGSAFTQCMTISTISVAADNKNYKGHETQPLLLNVEGTTIVLAYGPVTEEGGSGEYRLPDNLTTIGESAFSGQNGIRKLYIPASVTSIGANAFEFCRSLEEIEFAEGSLLTEIGAEAFASCYSLKTIALPEGLTDLGKSAFSIDVSLTEVVLPSSLIHVGSGAFQYCSALETVNIPALVSTSGFTAQSMFADCPSLKNVTFSKDITWLPKYLFDNCTSLESIAFPAEVKSLTSADTSFDASGLKEVDLGGLTVIPASMFKNCASLTTIDLSKVTEIGANAFQNCAALSDVDLSTVTTLGNYAFSGCSSITEVNLSSAVTLGTYIFQNNTSLTHVILNDVVSTLNNYSFDGCVMLATIDTCNLSNGTVTQNAEGVATLPSSLTTLGTYAFRKTAIREVTIPRGVTKLPSNASNASSSSYAFNNCPMLEKVVLHDAMTAIGSYTFTNCGNLRTVQYLNAQNELIGNEGELTLPEGLEILGSHAFGSGRGTSSTLDEGERGASFTKVFIPESVKYIGLCAFQDCLDLEEAVYLSNSGKYSTSSTAYANNLFDGCTSLQHVVLNDALTAIGNNAFRNCTSLTTVDLYDSTTKTTTENEEGVAVLPSSLSYLDYGAFTNTAIREVTIPRALTVLSSKVTSNTSSSSVFADCAKLEKVILHDALQSIGEETFMNCTSLKTIQYAQPDGTIVGEEGEVTLPNSLTLLGDYAFSGSAVEKAVIPESLTKVGRYLFQDCTSLKEAQYLTSSYRYGTGSSNYSTYVFAGCTALEKVVLSDGITYLPDRFFSGCSALKTVQVYNSTDKTVSGNENEVLLPDAITHIGISCFNGCSSVTSITLPSSLTSVASDAFLAFADIEIVIPAGVTEIDDNAFCGHTVSVEDGNTAYFAQDGMLFSIDGTVLSAPAGMTGTAGSMIVPEEVVKIGSYALNQVTGITEITVTTDQITEYSFAYFTGDVIVKLGESKVLAAYAFADYRGTSVILPEGLEEIGDHAFHGASNLTKIDIPDTVQTVGAQVFRDCSSLLSVTLPEGIEVLGGFTFYNNNALMSVTLPSTLKTMGNQEFKNCTSLTSIVLPENLEYIGSTPFGGCTNLKEVTILSLKEAYSYGSSTKPFVDCPALEKIVLGDGVEILPDYFFHEMTNLTQIDLPDNITSIGEYAFRLSGITSLVVPANVTTIGIYAFADCAALETVYIPEGLTAIDKDVFYNCTSLKNVFTYRINEEGEMEILNQIEEGVADLSCITSINTSAFGNCTSLSEVIFSENLTTLGGSAFKGSGLKSVTVPGSISVLSASIFESCLSLETVVLEEGVTEIGSKVFLGCTALKNVTLPESLVEIGSNAFENCTALMEIVIPAGVTSIFGTAFGGWTAEQKIIAQIYALDSSCNWNMNWKKNCMATLEFVVLYSYGSSDTEVNA